jgi:hypothetical protein
VESLITVVTHARRDRVGRFIALGISALLVGLALPGITSGYHRINRSGTTGSWSTPDNSQNASLACSYDADDLQRVDIQAPSIFGRSTERRLVGWRFQVLRRQWWRAATRRYYVAYESPRFKAYATRSQAAAFEPGEWRVPAEWRTAYDAFKVRITVSWYGSTGTRVVGSTTVEFDYHIRQTVGDPDSASIQASGRCVGSFRAPVAPPAEPRVNVPTGFVRMSHWQPYWKHSSATRVQSMIAELQRMNQTGVVLMGMASGANYQLPKDVALYLRMFREAGIKPYLALWISNFSDWELRVATRAWKAGDGQWAGMVIDVESGLETAVQRHRAATLKRLSTFMTRFRPLTPFLAYTSYAYPSDHRFLPYSELNRYCDAFMPQLYFRSGKMSALRLLDKLQGGIDYESGKWSEAPKPIIPVVNDWGHGVIDVRLRQYIDISLARYGAVSGWRLHPDMEEETKDIWASVSP